jgi:predicted Zn-dependent protease
VRRCYWFSALASSRPVAPELQPESDAQRERPAPAPAPPPAPAEAALARRSRGFNPRGHRLLIELVLILAVLVGVGVSALRGGGALASVLTPLVPLSVDRKLGEMADATLFARDCPNPAAKKYVEQLAQPLLDAARPLPFELRFRVVDDSAVNAMALPGGFVVVNRGLLEAAQSGEEVAGVLGHEIQHALLRHGTRRMLREMGGALALSVLFGGSDLHDYAQVGSRLTGLKYDRAEEREADQRGVALLVRARIDPSGLARFFERLSKDDLNPPELLSTHPDPGNRAREIRATSLDGAPRELPKPSAIQCSAEGPRPSE